MAPLRIGVVGCGAVAQVHHLPNLKALPDEFDVAGICDLSPTLARIMAADYQVPFHTNDYRELLKINLDAVLLCHSDPKTEVAVAAFQAGLNVFIEKPMCYSLRDADTIINAARASKTVGMVAYMKVYDPAYELAQKEAASMDTIRFIQVNHLHPNNELHLRNFRLKRFYDLPSGPEMQGANSAAIEEAIGAVPADVKHAFQLIAGSMIHDIYGLRFIAGQPESVVSTEIWNNGKAINTILAYPEGARCAASWIDLPKVWEFTETLEVYSDDRRSILEYPCGFARGIPSRLTIHGIDKEGRSFRREPAIEWESAFVRELRHFYACITEGIPCRTPVEGARSDTEVIIDIVRAYIEKLRAQ